MRYPMKACNWACANAKVVKDLSPGTWGSLRAYINSTSTQKGLNELREKIYCVEPNVVCNSIFNMFQRLMYVVEF